MLANETYAPTTNTHAPINNYRGGMTPAMKPAISAKLAAVASDDLKMIKGIGPVIEKALNAEGIRHYRQIARFNAANVQWVNSHLDFPGRIEREEWISQAKVLVAQQEAEALLAKQEAELVSEEVKPTLLTQPRNGIADDLKRIKGIGLVLEKALQNLGIYHYYQLAALTNANAKWIEKHIFFPGVIKRENWPGQAHALRVGKGTEYSGRFDTGKTPYQE